MNILVLGGAGFLGSNLVRYCLHESYDAVTVVDSLEPRLRSTTATLDEVWSEIEFVQGDMRDATLMADLVREHDVIFNCAGQSSHPVSIDDPLFDVDINCRGNLILLEAIRDNNPDATVVYPSSSTVIGRTTAGVIDESHPRRPLDIYSANKGAAEDYYRIYNVVHDLKTIVLRFANLYGPYGKGFPEFGFINYFIHLAMQGEEITVYGAGKQQRNVMFVEDAAAAMYHSVSNPELVGKAVFAAHDQHLSVCDVAETIVSVFGRGRVVHVEWPDVRRRIEVRKVRISSERLRSVSSWRPRYSFEEGLVKVKRVMEGTDYVPAAVTADTA